MEINFLKEKKYSQSHTDYLLTLEYGDLFKKRKKKVKAVITPNHSPDVQVEMGQESVYRGQDMVRTSFTQYIFLGVPP